MKFPHLSKVCAIHRIRFLDKVSQVSHVTNYGAPHIFILFICTKFETYQIAITLLHSFVKICQLPKAVTHTACCSCDRKENIQM